MRKNKGFLIGELLIILMISSIFILATFKIMTIKKKLEKGNNSDVAICIISESAADLASKACSASIFNIVNNSNNAYNTLLYYINSKDSAQSSSASKVLVESCKQGSAVSCKYFVNMCIADSNQCNNSSNNDLHYFLTLNYTDSGTDKIKEQVEQYYNVLNTNIINELYSSCSANDSSAACKFIKDKCSLGKENECNYFVNKCKETGACNIAGTDFDLYYFLILNYTHTLKGLISKLVSPLYNNSNPNIYSTVDAACHSKTSSIACTISDLNELNCLNNNDDAACNIISDQCINSLNYKKCNSLVNACNNGKTNACKYGYTKEINKSCLQIRTKTGPLYSSGGKYISVDNLGARKSVYCSGDWTRLIAEDYSNATTRSSWNIIQADNNRIRNDYVDPYGNPQTTTYYVMGGQNVLSGKDYSADMYLEKSFDYSGVPHTMVRYELYGWYCGPWNGERFYIYYDDILKYTSANIINNTPGAWKTWDNTQNCNYKSAPFEANSTENIGKFRIESNLSTSPAEKSLGISTFYVYVK